MTVISGAVPTLLFAQRKDGERWQEDIQIRFPGKRDWGGGAHLY